MKKTVIALLFAAAAQPAAARDQEDIFKETLGLWVAASVRMDACSFNSDTDKKLEAILDAAAEAFHPGFFSWSARSTFREDMELEVAVARLTGYADAKSKGCFGVDIIERSGRSALESMIDMATD